MKGMINMANIKIENGKFSSNYISYFKYEPTNVCPVCKANISPFPLYAFAYDNKDRVQNTCILNYCTGCHSPFISTYLVSTDENGNSREINYIGSEPNRFAKQNFDDKITMLSPQFDKIYNQALAAESSGLDEIAGLGYRKALEFLIKDYAIHKYPDEAESIKLKPLVQCIKIYISADNIKTLAERSAWIGNDEAHYIRKQENRDVSDMKSFIQAIVYFIGMMLITEDAASMNPVK